MRSTIFEASKVFLALFGGLGQGGVINILPVKPFESVMVIKGYTNKIELN